MTDQDLANAKALEEHKAHLQKEVELAREERGTLLEARHGMFRAAIDFALAAIRAILLINGGAAVALLAFLGHLIAKGAGGNLVTGVLGALHWFALGVGAGALTAGAAYLAQILYTERIGSKAGARLRVVAVVLAFIAYACFFMGIYGVMAAFSG